LKRSDFQKGVIDTVTSADQIIVLDADGSIEPQIIDFAKVVTSNPFTGAFWPNSSTALTGAGLANGDRIPVLDGSVPKYIEADELAQGSQFSGRYASTTAFPNVAFSSWTPTVTSAGGSITTVGTTDFKYLQIGKLVFGYFSIFITTKGTASGALLFAPPVAPRSTFRKAIGVYQEYNAEGADGIVNINSATELALTKGNNSTPFTFDNVRFSGTFWYEAA
jgi:hypothetical protein